MTQNSTAELCLTALNINVKSEGKLTFASKNDMRGLRNFHQSTWKSPNWDFDGILLSKVENAWAQNLQGRRVICHENKEWWKIRGGIDLSFQNWHEEFDKFWPKHSKISKICTLIGSFWSKYIMFELKKCRGVINQNKNSKEPDRPDAVWKLYFTLEINE